MHLSSSRPAASGMHERPARKSPARQRRVIALIWTGAFACVMAAGAGALHIRGISAGEALQQLVEGTRSTLAEAHARGHERHALIKERNALTQNNDPELMADQERVKNAEKCRIWRTQHELHATERTRTMLDFYCEEA